MVLHVLCCLTSVVIDDKNNSKTRSLTPAAPVKREEEEPLPKLPTSNVNARRTKPEMLMYLNNFPVAKTTGYLVVCICHDVESSRWVGVAPVAAPIHIDDLTSRVQDRRELRGTVVLIIVMMCS